MKIFPQGRWAERPVWFWAYTIMLAIIVAAQVMETIP